MGLYLEKNKTLQQSIVKNKIYKKLITVDMNPLLPRNKGKSVAQLQHKILQMAYQSRFQILFIIGSFLL